MPNSKLFLIDGHALCYRSFFAIKELTTSNGQPTNAVFGFVRALRTLIEQYNPKYMAVCFDSKGKTLRAEKYDQYKIQRPSMPDELRSQIPIIKEAVKLFSVSAFEKEGYEADDLIGTLTASALKDHLDVVIATDDKDLFQLAEKRVDFFSFRLNALLTEKDVEKKLGFKSHQIVDFLSLAGDASDNIPGVSGVGKVTATQLIHQFGGLDEIFDNLDDVKRDSVRTKLIENKDMAFLSRSLVLLDKEAPIEFSLKSIELGTPDKEGLFKMFKDLEFRRLAEEFSEVKQERKDVKTSSLIKTQDLKKFLNAISKTKKCAVLVREQAQEDFFNEKQFLFSLGDSHVYQVAAKQVEDLKLIFEDETIEKIVFNYKDLLKTLSELEIDCKGSIFDLMLAGYLLAPMQSQLSIHEFAWKYLKASLKEKDESQQVSVCFDLASFFTKELESRELASLLKDVELPLSRVLFEMEKCGVNLDLDLLGELSSECEVKIAGLIKKVHHISGEEFNLGSPKQLAHVLFEKLKLPVVKKTKTGFSTDESVLKVLESEHEVPALILEYRQLSKLKSTYIDALPVMVNSVTGRIHAQFDQAGTETGRLSSRQPNLQNIPIRTEMGRQIRKAFIPLESSHILVAADYSQVELRILAHLSQDKELMKAFKEDQDIHSYTASLIFDMNQEDVTYHERDTAKRVNFGIVYGMSAFGLSKDLGIHPKDAEEFIKKYFLRYKRVKQFMDEQIALCEKVGYVTTLLNRRRYIPEINSRNKAVKQFAERQAINTPVQGSAADLMKIAMINVHNELVKRKLDTRMLITVHDELVFDVPKCEEKEVINLAREIMANPFKLSVPIVVDVKVGKNWLEMEKV